MKQKSFYTSDLYIIAGNYMSYNNGYPFSTYDRDYDSWYYNCADYDGAWWHFSCSHVRLNQDYIKQLGWYSNNFIKSEMMIQRTTWKLMIQHKHMTRFFLVHGISYLYADSFQTFLYAKLSADILLTILFERCYQFDRWDFVHIYMLHCKLRTWNVSERTKED